MAIIRRTIWLLALLTGILGCNDGEEPKYSPIPLIESVHVSYVAAIDTRQPDTLKLTFDITDGDFDLGLDASNPHDLDSPFHNMNYLLLSSSGLKEIPWRAEMINNRPAIILRTNHEGKLAAIGMLRKSLPEIPPYNCTNYNYASVYAEENMIDGSYNITDTLPGPLYHITDTLLYKSNENHVNIEVEFLVEENGTYEPFPWRDPPYCTSFDQRFFRITNSKIGKRSKNGPFTFFRESKSTGQLTYLMNSLGFRVLFANKNLKLRIQIKDRALNKSNIIETAPIVIQ